MMTHGSLFSGIEGFGEGARRAGEIENIFHVEQNSFCHDIIRKHSNAPIFSDIRTFDGTPYRGKVNILSGGFPCQDYSVATTLKNSKGLIGKKGVLWWSIHKILSEKIR